MRKNQWMESIRELLEEEEGVAMTEFVITLPVFLILMAGLITLGHLGVSKVAVQNTAYGNMWADAARVTTDDMMAMTPRSELENPLEAVVGQVLGDAATNFTEGLPFWSPDITIPGATAEGGASAAVGLEGHWGEAEYYAESGGLTTGGMVDHRDHGRLENVDANGEAIKQVLGPSGSSKPRLALDDNLMSNTAFEGFDISDLWAGPTSLTGLFDNAKNMVSGGASDLFYDAISGSGFVPGLMAGTRYGRGVGAANSEVEVQNRLFDHTFEYSALYMTAPSPNPDGPFNSEKVHWLFYVGGSQLNGNQRQMLNLFSQDLSDSDLDNPDRYPDF